VQDLLIHYTLDVMHCEMNLTNKFLKTIMEKNDTVKVRRDLRKRNIRRHLWFTANRRGKMMKPQASCVLTTAEFEVFARTLESVKMPTGYSSNLGKHIRGQKFGALKPHDYHVLMQQLLPLVLWGLLKPGARMVVMQMCKIFRRIYTKVYNPANFDSLELDVVESMPLLEMEFPL
jgi:hypothetical protein